jgi:hypothetical protein
VPILGGVTYVRGLVVALVLAAAAWAWAATSLGGRCTPDDLTGCDTVGSIRLWLALGLPVVLFLLLVLLAVELIALWRRR